MKDHEISFQQRPSSLLGRRDFLKLASALGLSAGALDAMLFQSTALAATQDVTSGLVGYWKLDEGNGSHANDSSGNNHAGTLNNAPTWTAGKSGTALSFHGGNTSVTIGNNVLNTSTSFTVAAWVQLADVNTWHTAVSQDGNNVSGFFLQFTAPGAGGQFAFSLIGSDSASSPTVRATSKFQPLPNTWYHIAGVYDAGSKQSRLYVDGALQNTASVPAAWNATGTTAIGRALFNTGQVDFWSGLIDDVRVYNRALSDQEISSVYGVAPTISPIRPPAVPLIVRGPYVNTWQTSNVAPGTWSTFWNGNVKAITGIARIDGAPYIFFGAPGNIGATQNMAQVQLEITPTQSRYVFQGGGVTVAVTFLSPIEANDIQRLSMQFGAIFVQAYTNDGNTHNVRLYLDISGEWAHGTDTTLIKWGSEQVAHTNGSLTAFSVTPNAPTVLAETNDYPSWGSAIWATNSAANVTYQSGADNSVRSQAITNGSLNNTNDTNQPRAINNNWPVFGFNVDLGTLNGTPSAPLTFVLGHVRQPAVSYQGNQIAPLWQSYWSRWQDMLSFFYDDANAALGRANALDASITNAAVAANGIHYAALCSLAARQAFGGVELVNTQANPWMFLKEISSSGNVSTIDVVYPSFPIFYYLNPTLVSLLLAPILTYVESGLWPKTFCVHDLGASYPNASGHNDGGGENMQVEETSNMLIMAAAYITQLNASVASTYANAHYKIFSQWANYLNAPNGGNPSRPNALDPLLQNQTDDFTGLIAHSTNLALKGILGIGAMGIIAHAAGNSNDQQFFASTASNLIGQWAHLGQDPTQPHLDIAYIESDTANGTGAGTYSLKYNAFPDKLLGLALIPSSVLQEEASWYQERENQYGIPLDTRHTYTKSDWELWTAASTDVAALRQYLVDALYQFANTTSSRVPFTDWYDTISGTQNGFQARPVAGGLFSILARIKSGH